MRLRIHTPEIYILLPYFDSYLKFLICPGLIILLISLSSSGPSKSCLSKEFLHIPSFLVGNTQITAPGKWLEMPNNVCYHKVCLMQVLPTSCPDLSFVILNF